MIYAIPTLALLALIFGPQLWVRYVLRKHSRHLDGMPGTGSELARHLLQKFGLTDVKVKQGGKDENYYHPEQNTVCLSPDVYTGKSLTAVAVAAHEVGHAIQFNKQEPVSQLRGKYLNKAHRIQAVGVFILTVLPIVSLLIRIPHLALVSALIGILTMAASVALYVAILPEEFDASYNKALPILATGYVPETYMPAVRQILKACALTYVAGALADILRLWRWIAILR
ncbi:MAG: zinc metallopeptidase [Gammaproteobacteria bacterium]|nr:zinc metallopeptidase [Gammaproteobacteria bacterium]MDH5801534.1 zinc metallopeptidase [Gammaproteobacteria bacterium]